MILKNTVWNVIYSRTWS